MTRLETANALDIINASGSTQQQCLTVAETMLDATPSEGTTIEVDLSVWRAVAQLLACAGTLPTVEDFQQWSREAEAEFDQAVGIRMVPASNPEAGVCLLPFKVGGAL